MCEERIFPNIKMRLIPKTFTMSLNAIVNILGLFKTIYD